ncbi:MAG TPA: hypothetical protein VEN81_04570 [Planctomycetota bacterium]|nr:hypothetical protein [Planctomycetota bacterium]
MAVLAVLLAAGPGDAEIQGSGIVLKTTSRLAGAIDSLSWGGKEFIDSYDHGRQLQSACALGDGGPNFWAETYNPTEAGSRKDGQGPTSTSKLLALKAEGNILETRTQMAFWLAPGEKSEGRPALNSTGLSKVILSKRVVIGIPEMSRVIEYTATFTLPKDESHPFAQFEALTGYMPAEFTKFLGFDPGTRSTRPLSDGPGEQELPVIFSTESGSHAVGIFSPDPLPGYGRWRFRAEKVVKWNCVFRERKPEGVAAGDHTFHCFVAVGTLADVTESLQKLARQK